MPASSVPWTNSPNVFTSLLPPNSDHVMIHLVHLAWAVCFPITDHVIFSRQNVPFIHLEIIITYRRLFEQVKAGILKSIITLSEMGQ